MDIDSELNYQKHRDYILNFGNNRKTREERLEEAWERFLKEYQPKVDSVILGFIDYLEDTGYITFN